MANESQTTRVQLELAQGSYERLSSLKARTEATSYAEVMKNALRLYESLIDRQEAGGRFYIKERDGSLVEYVVLV